MLDSKIEAHAKLIIDLTKRCKEKQLEAQKELLSSTVEKESLEYIRNYESKVKQGKKKSRLSISNFILTYAAKEEISAKVLFDIYAQYTDSTRDSVRGNVSNALNRLVKTGFLEVRYGKSGRKGGGIYQVPKEKQLDKAAQNSNDKASSAESGQTV
jgi:hypothetical protein